jgi:hypothetical protein
MWVLEARLRCLLNLQLTSRWLIQFITSQPRIIIVQFWKPQALTHLNPLCWGGQCTRSEQNKVMLFLLIGAIPTHPRQLCLRSSSAPDRVTLRPNNFIYCEWFCLAADCEILIFNGIGSSLSNLKSSQFLYCIYVSYVNIYFSSK